MLALRREEDFRSIVDMFVFGVEESGVRIGVVGIVVVVGIFEDAGTKG